MTKYRITKEWDDHEAEHYYELQKFVRKEADHSCYGCYDAWKWERKRCTNNCDRWETKSAGDKEWAKRIAKHYNIAPEDVEL